MFIRIKRVVALGGVGWDTSIHDDDNDGDSWIVLCVNFFLHALMLFYTSSFPFRGLMMTVFLWSACEFLCHAH